MYKFLLSQFKQKLEWGVLFIDIISHFTLQIVI